jgi:hypothetical protein
VETAPTGFRRPLEVNELTLWELVRKTVIMDYSNTFGCGQLGLKVLNVL